MARREVIGRARAFAHMAFVVTVGVGAGRHCATKKPLTRGYFSCSGDICWPLGMRSTSGVNRSDWLRVTYRRARGTYKGRWGAMFRRPAPGTHRGVGGGV